MAGSNSSSVTLPPRSLEPAVSPNPSNAPMREDPHGMREESFRALHEDSRPIRDGIPRISRSQREDVRTLLRDNVRVPPDDPRLLREDPRMHWENLQPLREEPCLLREVPRIVRELQREEPKLRRDSTRLQRDDLRPLQRENPRLDTRTREDSCLESRMQREDSRMDTRMQREDLRMDCRMQREDPRIDSRIKREDLRIDSRLQRDDLRLDCRMQREDSRTDSRMQREDLRADSRMQRDDTRLDPRMQRDDTRMDSRIQFEDVRLDSRIQSYHSQMSRPPYVLPWEELLAEEIPPSECAGSPSPYAEDERAHGRRSRQHRRPEPPDVASAPQHTISGGTGGSEEWHSPQQTPPNRTTQYIRDHDHDECQAWSQGSSKRRSRQPVLGVPIRSPEPIDPWRDPRREAWRGETPDFHGGLPSIRNSFATGLPGINANEGSRAPSRLTTGTPTPREEDSLDLVARQMHIGPGSRWNASGESEWLSLGTPAEFGHVRPQHMTHDTRGTPSHEGKSLAGLSRRSALSGIFHAH